MRVTVIDMQPITPAVGGGRLRLLGLYHALGPNIDCTYVGSYDWPGEKCRDAQIAPGLREIVVPLSEAHHAAAQKLSAKLDGRTIIDTAFPMHAALSPEYLETARQHMRSADVVVFTHPWCFPPLCDDLRAEQLVVYDSQNVEILLKTEYLADIKAAVPLLRQVAAAEKNLLLRADVVMACSDEDVALYQRAFNANPAKFHIAPNGTFASRFPEIDRQEQLKLRKRIGLKIDTAVAIFLGSNYGPNIDAAYFIVRKLAPACPNITFIVAGGVGHSLAGESLTENILVTGALDDSRRDEILLAADFALNPMSAGSGTNIKMFDYMAAGLPVLTSEIGARGIGNKESSPKGVFIEPLDAFPKCCRELAATLTTNSGLRESVREHVQRYFSWEHISPEIGRLLKEKLKSKARHVDGRKIAVLSTWNVTCGIGEHTASLVEAIEQVGAAVVVLGNHLSGHRPLGFERDLRTPVRRVWNWDNCAWQDSRVDRRNLEDFFSLFRPSLFIVQHHSAFAPVVDIEYVLELARSRGVTAVVEMHDARSVPAADKIKFCELGAHLVVHHSDEIAELENIYPAKAHAFPLPVQNVGGAMRTAGERRRSHTIGGFGFLRPYKGLMVAIKTLAILRRSNPELRYRGWHAFYEGDNSEEYLRDCYKEAERLGIRDAIEIDTRFLALDEVLSQLSSVDVVLMPYEPSGEGGSAAVNLALAAGRPTVASPSEIFRSVSEAICIVDRHEPDAYAMAVQSIFEDPVVAEKLETTAKAWAESHSYLVAAKRFMQLS